MADFLSRLIERTMSVVPAIEPVIAPMYAQERQRYQPEALFAAAELEDVRSPVEDTFTTGARSIASAVRTTVDSVGMGQQPDKRGDELPHPSAELQARSAAALLSAMRNAQHSPATAISLSPAVARDQGKQSRQAPGQSGAGFLPEQQSSSRSERLPRRSVEPPARGAVRNEAAHYSLDRSGEPQAHGAVSLRSEVRNAQHLPVPAAPLTQAVTHGQGEQNGQAQELFLTTASLPTSGEQSAFSTQLPVERASSASPAIQVTIGRIEVRATPPPEVPQPSTQRTAASLMSLDQYLRQRGKGGSS